MSRKNKSFLFTHIVYIINMTLTTDLNFLVLESSCKLLFITLICPHIVFIYVCFLKNNVCFKVGNNYLVSVKIENIVFCSFYHNTLLSVFDDEDTGRKFLKRHY